MSKIFKPTIIQNSYFMTAPGAKVLIILEKNPFVQSSAPTNRLLSLIYGLLDNNIKVDILFLNGYSSKDEFKTFKTKGTFKRTSYFYFLPLLLRNKYVKKVAKRLIPTKLYTNYIVHLIQSNNYDYLWLGVSPRIANIGIRLFKKKLKIKYIHERSEYSWISLSAKSHKKYLHKFLPNVDFLFIMTNKLIDYYRGYVSNNTKIIHVPMTVDFARFEKDQAYEYLNKPYIGYCGTMNCAKDGVDILISAFINIMDKYPKHHLYIVGPPHPKDDYELLLSLILKHNATKRISFLGYKKKEYIPGFLKNASALAMARPESKQAEGGFPTKLGEYLATGNPVCVTAVGEIENYLTDNQSAYVAQPNDVKSFSDVLSRAISSPKAKEVGINGKRIALQNFNKDIQAKTIADILTNRQL